MLNLLGATDGVWDWRVGTEEIRFAPGFRKLLGFTADDLQSLPDRLESLFERVHADDWQRVWAEINISLTVRICPLSQRWRSVSSAYQKSFYAV
jgi:PAS domain-containing protein